MVVTKKKLLKKMKIKLNNKFYKKEAIEEAIKSFSQVCNCKILDGSFELEMAPLTEISSDLKGEFCNFVLGITKDQTLF